MCCSIRKANDLRRTTAQRLIEILRPEQIPRSRLLDNVSGTSSKTQDEEGSPRGADSLKRMPHRTPFEAL